MTGSSKLAELALAPGAGPLLVLDRDGRLGRAGDHLGGGLAQDRPELALELAALVDDALMDELEALIPLVQDVDAMKRVIGALNPKLAGFEASCFDGRYITGDVSDTDFAAMDAMGFTASASQSRTRASKRSPRSSKVST